MAKGAVRRRFVLTDGTAKLELTWRSGEALPDFGAVPILAARVAADGFEWAVGETHCPSCRLAFRIGAEQATREGAVADGIGGMLLTRDALPMLEMFGNVSIDFGASASATCPECGEVFSISANATSSELMVTVDDGRILVKCDSGRVVSFNEDGSIDASDRRRLGHPTVEASEFVAVPRFVGFSEEARDWLCLVLGIRAEDRPDSGAVDLLDLSLRRRFKGYGEDFIAEARRSIVQPAVRQEALNGLFALPRELADKDALIEMFGGSGLPDKPSVRKAAAARPAALALIAKYMLGELCGGDPNLAVTLLRAPELDAAWCSSLLDKQGRLGDFVQLAMKVEKPSYLVKQLLNVDGRRMRECVDCFDGLDLGSYKKLLAYRLARKDYGFAAIVAKPTILAAYAKSTRSISIKYGEKASLQGEYEGFRFQLPRQTGRFASAGATLRNCLGDGYAERAALGETLVFLVSKEGNLVAAVEVRPDTNEVFQMFAKANRMIKPAEDLGIAVALWARDKGIGLHGCSFA